MRQKPSIKKALVIMLASLLCGCISSVSHEHIMKATHQRMKQLPELQGKRLSRLQIEQLSQLKVDKATRSEITKILGEPFWEGQNQWNETIMNYNTGEGGTGAEVRFLMVFHKGNRYTGYLWMDQVNFLSREELDKARFFISKDTTKTDLIKCWGPPVRVGFMHGQGQLEFLAYSFKPSQTVVDLGISPVTFVWTVDNEGNARFYGMKPEFVWKYKDSFSKIKGDSGEMSSESDKLTRNFNAMLEKEIRREYEMDHKKIERAEIILSKLLKVSPLPIGTVKLKVINSKEINGHAYRGPQGRMVILSSNLLARLENDDQLAAVISHELGHFMDDHFVVPLEFLLKLDPDPQVFRMSQAMEHEADIRGAELAVRGGYNPGAGITVLEILRQLTPNVPKKLSTHPPHLLRQQLLGWYCKYRWPKTTGNAKEISFLNSPS
jgi:hypothetical protein